MVTSNQQPQPVARQWPPPHPPKYYLPHPSDAVRAMCDGLVAWAAQPGNQVNMGTYGGVDTARGVCFGCAATATVCSLVPAAPVVCDDRRYVVVTRRGLVVVPSKNQVIRAWVTFERDIDSLRCGDPDPLAYSYGARQEVQWATRHMDLLPYMGTRNWRAVLPVYRDLATALAAAGL